MSCPHSLTQSAPEKNLEASGETTLASLPCLGGPGILFDYWLRPERFLARCGALGERFILKFPGVRPMVCITGSEDVRAVFTGDYNAVCLGEAIKRLAPHEILFGPEILVAGEEHLKLRRMLNPHFRGEALKVLEPLIAEKTREALLTWPLNQPTALLGQVQPLILEIIIAAIFGVREPERTARLRDAVMHFIEVAASKRFAFDFALAVMRGGKWRGKYRYVFDARKAVDDILAEEIAARRANTGDTRADLLAAFLGMRDEDGMPMPENVIFGFMRGLLVGGYETTALTIAWMGERLSRHPEVIRRLEEAVDQDDDGYIDALVTETMRVRSPVMFTERSTEAPFNMNGLDVPAENFIIPFIQLVQWNSRSYDDPMRFDPERFVKERPNRFAWIPFGGGVHMCLGMALSLLETRVIVREIFKVRTLQPSAAPDEPIKRRTVMQMPKHGARVVWLARD